eukprot:TRINITY_DN5917_c0_g1_i1.p1 TRINITY_DN5917_c0_g1~~TRINITY_DN5917_c0_g1_i1.p1  ORF type:complete len:745 (-),score=153.43 TRINITY_DN5917_c0_g1_i1:82-2316(-)
MAAAATANSALDATALANRTAPTLSFAVDDDAFRDAERESTAPSLPTPTGAEGGRTQVKEPTRAKVDWKDLKETRKSVGLTPWPRQDESLEDLLGTLDRQKWDSIRAEEHVDHKLKELCRAWDVDGPTCAALHEAMVGRQDYERDLHALKVILDVECTAGKRAVDVLRQQVANLKSGRFSTVLLDRMTPALQRLTAAPPRSLAVRRAASDPSLLRRTAPMEGDRLAPSTLPGSSKYSFGPGYQRPRHLKGKMKIPVLEPRDAECIPGNAWVPGPGAYENRHYLGLEAGEAGGGGTGGWNAKEHGVFLRVFNSFKQQATEEFFDRLTVLLPDIPRLKIAEHVKWFGNYEHHKMKLDHQIARFREEKHILREVSSGAETLSKGLLQRLENSKEERLGDTRRVRERLERFHSQAENERERWGLKEQNPPMDGFKPVQHHHGGAYRADENLRAHPEFKRAPAYSWSASHEIRDVRDRCMTDLAEVRSTTAMTNPGPGHYIGLHEADRIMKKQPCYSVPQAPIRYLGGLPRANPDAARRTGDLERRLTAAGVRRGEIQVTLIWNTGSSLNLHVMPPGAPFGSNGICLAQRCMAGGKLDVCRHNDPGRGERRGTENVSWPYFTGRNAPPKGRYEAFMTLSAASTPEDTPWLCRVLIGQNSHWCAGVVRAGTEGQVGICSFSYDEPEDSSTKIQKELEVIQLKKPSWTQGKEDSRKEACSTEGFALTNRVSTDHLGGPGRYTHLTSMHSQY